jgi:hypothetical protein
VTQTRDPNEKARISSQKSGPRDFESEGALGAAFSRMLHVHQTDHRLATANRSRVPTTLPRRTRTRDSALEGRAAVEEVVDGFHVRIGRLSVVDRSDETGLLVLRVGSHAKPE